MAGFERTVDGSEGADFTFTRTGTSGTAGVIIARITVDDAGTVQEAAFSNVVASNNLVLTGVTAAADNLLAQFATTLNGTADSWTEPGTAVERIDTTASGTAVRYAVGDEVVGAGATGTRTWVHTSGQSARGAVVAINPAPPIDLAVADAAQAQAADSPTLVQTHVLAVDDAAQAHAADNVTLTQVHVLAVDDAVHAHASDSPALTQVHVLQVDDATHSHTADSPVLDVPVAPIDLVVADASHTQTAETPTLTQVHELTVADAAHVQTAESPTLGLVVALVVDDTSHTLTSDTPTLTQTHVLQVADGHHVQVADQLTLTQVHQLAVDSATHAQAALEVTLTQGHVLDVDDATHTIVSGEPVLFTYTPRDITVTAAIAPPRYVAALPGATRVATLAPARHAARIEET